MARTDLAREANRLGASPRAVRAGKRAARTVEGLMASMTHGALRVTRPDGVTDTFGVVDVAHGHAVPHITVNDWSFYGAVLGGGSVGLGEAFIAGAWDADDPVGVVRALIRNRAHVDTIRLSTLARAASMALWHRLRANRKGGSRANIQAHYDLSNDFYKLFLDDTMTYSAGVFDRPGMTLRESQIRKWELLADRLRLEPGMRVLEIGCGWGGWATWAAEKYDISVHGITLSDQQCAYATQLVADLGLEDRITIELVDYRDVAVPDGGFDRVLSIEMLEAVGHKFLPTFFETVDNALAPHGVAAVQVITIPDQRYRNYRRRPDFIQRYVFPGGHLPSLEAMQAAMVKGSNLIVHDVSDIGMDYAETLRLWRERFHANMDDIRALGFDERFTRLWDFYLFSCEAAFAERYVQDLQLTYSRSASDGMGYGNYGDAAEVASVDAAVAPELLVERSQSA